LPNAKPALLWLADALGIDRGELKKKENFDARMKLQKASYLLHYLRVSPFDAFHFNLYLRGPYSSGLAIQYYDFDGDRPSTPEMGVEHAGILAWFSKFDLREMEIATSILLIEESNPRGLRDEEIYSVLTISKPWVSPDNFNLIIGELREKKLVR
jgi:uncharacterized protein YwgA